MTDADRPEFVKGLAVLGEAFNEPLSELRGEAYFDALSDLDVTAVLIAMRAALRSCTFFPKPAELRRLVTGSPEDRAEMAWVEAQRLVRRVGSYRNPNITDPSMRAAIDALGGWRTFCLSEDDPTWRANVFRRTYATMERRAAMDRVLLLPIGSAIAGLLDGPSCD